MKHEVLRGTVLGMAVAAASGVAQASLDDVRVNAFATLGVASMHGEADSTRYGISSEYKADETIESVSRAAVQIGYDFTDKLSGTLQLIADRGREANGIEANVDWAFLTYQATDELGLRAGKLRVPLFIFSETIDVGYSYPWVRPPQTFYQVMPFSSFYAVDALWNVSLGNGDLLVQPFVGRAEEQDINFFGHENADIDGEELVGVNLSYSLDYGLIRAGVFNAADGSATLNDGPLVDFTGGQTAAVQDSEVTFMSAGYHLEFGNWLTVGEIGKQDTKAGKAKGALAAQGIDQILEEELMYLMVGHRFGDWLPHITYAKNSTTDSYVTGSGDQESIILGLRYDWKPGIALKFEYEDIETNNDYNGRFFGGEDISPLRGNSGNRDAEIFTIAIDYVL